MSQLLEHCPALPWFQPLWFINSFSKQNWNSFSLRRTLQPTFPQLWCLHSLPLQVQPMCQTGYFGSFQFWLLCVLLRANILTLCLVFGPSYILSWQHYIDFGVLVNFYPVACSVIINLCFLRHPILSNMKAVKTVSLPLYPQDCFNIQHKYQCFVEIIHWQILLVFLIHVEIFPYNCASLLISDFLNHLLYSRLCDKHFTYLSFMVTLQCIRVIITAPFYKLGH